MATLAASLSPPIPAAARWARPRGFLPEIPLDRAGAALGATAERLYNADLVVDLGDSIGSTRWWRGLATILLLGGTALSLGLNASSLVAPSRPLATPAQQEEAQAGAISALAHGSKTGRRAPPNTLVNRLSEVPERPRLEVTGSIGSGGLEGALRRAGVGAADMANVRRLLAGVANTRGVSPGTSVNMVLGRRESRSQPRPLEQLDFRAAFDKRIAIKRDASGALQSRVIPIKIDKTPLRVTGAVGSSLQRAARAAGVPADAINEYIRQLSYVLDFQREVGGRDKFDMVIEHERAETGETRTGKLLYAGLVNGRSNVSLMRWGPRGEFFWQSGEGARKGLIRTPVDGARMSSGFGMRFHPVLNYSRMHQGTDFAAPRGTPVVASAAGKVIQAGWGGGYGNVVRVDHGKGMVTRYAHLHKIDVRAGQQIGQGQRIGQVGSTGLSTGPHLHYEVWQNGRPVDPRNAKLVGSNKLGGGDLRKFQSEMGRLKNLRGAG